MISAVHASEQKNSFPCFIVAVYGTAEEPISIWLVGVLNIVCVDQENH